MMLLLYMVRQNNLGGFFTLRGSPGALQSSTRQDQGRHSEHFDCVLNVVRPFDQDVLVGMPAVDRLVC